jgi:GDP/UDP-N,N'-diacetylbacillosamine 2-epimerase (hydrolysing)
MKSKKIVAVTGARSEYDLLYTVYKKLDELPQFDLSVIVTGAHLSEKYGYTLSHIEQDGFHIAEKIHNLVDSDKKIGRILSLGNQVNAIAQSLDRLKPDIVLVAGDREEAISVCMTAAYMDIPVAHFFGGDIAKDGNIDNSVRYAASKFAHLHFPTLEEHKETLLKLGEEAQRIHVVGNPALDRFLKTPEMDLSALERKLSFKLDNDYFVLIQHAIITEVEKQAEHIRTTLNAIVKSGKKCLINYPNSDPGNHAIIAAYNEYATKYPEQLYLFQNLDRLTYVNLLRQASCLLGNSSSGLLEAPSLGLPAINIGSRQLGRTHGKNVIFVGNNENEISAAIERVETDQAFLKEVAKKENPYGDGKATERIIDVLNEVELHPHFTHKNITY